MKQAAGIRFTLHAERMLVERRIERSWVERTIDQPDAIEKDPLDIQLLRYYRRIPERGGRFLRVVCRPEPGTTVVVTAFFDRSRTP